MPTEEIIKQAPVSVTLLGIITIIILSKDVIESIIRIGILLISFAILLWFNTHYFRWFRNKK